MFDCFQIFKKLQRLYYDWLLILRLDHFTVIHNSHYENSYVYKIYEISTKGCGDMMSVFKRLIRRELGEGNYNKYFTYIQKNLRDKSLESKEVYEDIYFRLKDRDIEAIAHMHDRLNDAMLLAFRISKTYIFALIAYIAGSIFLLSQGLMPAITIVALVLMSSLFLVKTYEFVINKYCFIDAQIVLVYKSVLERIILSHVKSKNL